MGIRVPSRNFCFTALLGAGACAGTAIAAENYSLWSHSSDLLLDTSPSGAAVTGDVTGFPVLLRLTSGNFIFSEARGRGEDIRFSKADGTPLDYQVDRWDSAKAVAEVWIKADTVFGNKAGQTLRMYWGNASAADSSDGNAAFSNGYAAVWHLGDAGVGNRPNAVAGGLPAAPVQYDGDESTPGMIGMADSLDGGSPGDYLDVGDGYTGFAGGFSYSVWVYPTAVKKWAHVLDLGNGEFGDNIILNRVNTSDSMSYNNYNGGPTPIGLMQIPGAWTLNQWSYFTLTVSGTGGKLYKNGALILSKTLDNTISAAIRTQNFLGKSNWAVDEYFQGKLDEPALSTVARSGAWVKLCYQNQKAGQNLVTLKVPDRCKARFAVPADTSANEESMLTLSATADCATGYSWTAVSGPEPRILDPEVKSLTVKLPRVAGDTVMVLSFNAAYPDSSPHRNIRVTIKESIPEPAFTLPPSLTWNGKDSLPLRPVISNLAAIRSSPDSLLSWAWTVSGGDADTAWLADGLLLASAPEGKLQIGLCLSNNGPMTCKHSAMTVSSAVTLAATARLRALPDWRSGHDALGRSPASAPAATSAAAAKGRPADAYMPGTPLFFRSAGR
jgi:hypothetical protein